MSTNYVSRKLKTATAKRFKDSFSDTGAQSTIGNIGYIFIGKSTANANDNVVSTITDTVANEKLAWDTMLGAKRVVPGDIEFVLPIQRWTANTRYMQYDDKLPIDILMSGGVDGNTTVYPMYVLNSENNVYKCICNNVNGLTQVEPTGTYNENDGYIVTESGNTTCYLWKYMYNIRESNKFLTSEWMPVPYNSSNTDISEYNIDTDTLIDGALAKIKMTTNGSGYFHTTINVASFSSSSPTRLLQVTGGDIDTNNVKVNMALSGTGLLTGTYIANIFVGNNTILLSNDTIGDGGGTGNSITVLTRVVIEGDGTGVLTDVDLSNTSIRKINVTNIGSGYTRANVVIYGSGTNATARAILPPKFGHGFNPAMEFAANNIMIVKRIGEVDATENGLIPTDTSFRQYGVVLSPYKYDLNVPLTDENANTVITQTLDITLLSGSSYTIGEYVYQGNISNPNFFGYVASQSPTVVKLTETYGTIQTGVILTGANSAVTRPVVSVKNPDLKPYAGDIVYAQNILKVERSDGQAEEIKLVFKF